MSTATTSAVADAFAEGMAAQRCEMAARVGSSPVLPAVPWASEIQVTPGLLAGDDWQVDARRPFGCGVSVAAIFQHQGGEWARTCLEALVDDAQLDDPQDVRAMVAALTEAADLLAELS